MRSSFCSRCSPLFVLWFTFSLFLTGQDLLAKDPRKPLSCGNPSPQAQAVFDYIESLRGKAILSGQQESAHHGTRDCDELFYLQRETGKLPAILGLDYIDYDDVTERAEAWWKRGGLPSICWHWGAPGHGMGFPASQKEVDIDEVLKPGTELNKIFLLDLDRTARELTRLRDAGVPVLWRPLHELNGSWFWWGKGGPERFKRLWRFMHDLYSRTYKLNNLIWVCGFTSNPEADWYPGDNYVDIVGADNYAQGPQAAMFEKARVLVPKEMPVAYHECGPMPDPQLLAEQKIGWSWFLTWHTIHIKEQNSPDYLRHVYLHPYVITLDRVPALTR